MKKIIPTLLLSTILSAGSAFAVPASVDLEFSVKATMHTVEGTAEAEAFEAVLSEDGKTIALEVAVPMESMITGNDKRDEEMRHVLREDLQSVLKGTLAPTPLAQLHPEGGEPGQIELMFSMAGQELPVEASVTDWEEDEDGLSFTVTFDVSQKAYGLEPISKMGLLKVKDTVHVVSRFEIEK